MAVTLSSQAPFARGGNRLCFVDPTDSGRCIKVRRPDFTVADRRRKKGFPKTLLPLSRFDDNREERQVMVALQRRYGEPLYRHVSRCFGFVRTDMGPGLVSELIRDDDGGVAQTLKKTLWDEGMTEACRQAVEALAGFWLAMRMPSRDLLLHNIVVQRAGDGGIRRLVVIDGLGSTGLIPMLLLPVALQRGKTQRKVANLHQRIQALLAQRGQPDFPGYHGLLLHDGRAEALGRNQ
ncbi:hypothetical protein B5T_03658 [Alloalcanivorax dieselolei B5]|uniref:PhoP regulatory network protein YrbL n=1 Tax=Alcanivorax dieselolei (strain DSM 16502 / CGMCC 1.3690 / MCCC 1A00001 / B-5) TaxID=930169 RepID=K0CJJ5_ALCDB|nr:YrbL family protein [Alloalcanivorax dieselolei]AFT71922.1 hypothetical protein B5T_03658 [Alloalcanivorax dieselolei B5]GGK08713.1 hypothetical protein GCM10007426_41300 [Alloalcanivorax dieselolei]